MISPQTIRIEQLKSFVYLKIPLTDKKTIKCPNLTHFCPNLDDLKILHFHQYQKMTLWLTLNIRFAIRSISIEQSSLIHFTRMAMFPQIMNSLKYSG